jgi:hypothetical protein
MGGTQIFPVNMADSLLADPKGRSNVIQFEREYPDDKLVLWDLE